MAFDVGSVVAHVKADMTDFKKGIGDAKGTLNDFGVGLADFGKQAAVFTGIATAAIVAFGKSSLDAYDESAKELAQLNAVLKSTGSIAGVTADQAIGLSKALQKTTTFSDEATLGAENLLLTFTNITDRIFPQATKTVLDMSVALGQDTKSSAIQLGKALQDPILGVTALRRVGVNFNKDQQEVIKNLVETGHAAQAQDMILKELNTEFGGSAAAAASTFGGKIEILKNKLNDFQETIGGVLVAIANFAASGDQAGLKKALDGLIPNEDVVNKLVALLSDLYDIFSKLAAWIMANQDLVIKFLAALAVAFTALLIIGAVAAAIFLITNPLFLVGAAITALFFAWETNFLGIRDITQTVVTAIVGFFNDYLRPAIEAFAAFWAAIWPTLSAILKAEWEMIVGLFQAGWALAVGIFKVGLDLLTGNWVKAWFDIKDTVANIWPGILGILNGALDMIKAWAGSAFDALTKPFNDAWHAIQDTVNKIKDALDFTKRHSPSVVDIVENGVDKVNKALAGLDFGMPSVTPHAAVNMSPASSNSQINQISINLDGAIISDGYAAQQIGEMVGDSIIKKLQQNVRF